MHISQRRIIVLAALTFSCIAASVASAAEKEGWSWGKMNPFRRDDTPLQMRSPATRKIAPTRFKPTRSAVKPKESPWKSVGNGTKKMVDGTKKLFTFGDSDKAPVARREPPVLNREPEKKKTNYTSWLPWSKTKTR